MIALAVVAATFATAAATADAAVQIGQQSWSLANSAPNPRFHDNRIIRDGLNSECSDIEFGPGIETVTGLSYQIRSFHSAIQETACITVDVSTACTGTNDLMSVSYSPGFNGNAVQQNWIGDLGNSPPAFTQYGFEVAGGAAFETVIEEVQAAGDCPSVTLTWTSDRPWATSAPVVRGVPAVGRTLTSILDIWAGSPNVARQWMRCDAAGSNCADISGATDQTYVPTDADVGSTLAVRESASDGGVTSTVGASGPTLPVFIPFDARENQSLGAGDSAITSDYLTYVGASRCGATKELPPPGPGAVTHFYDTYAITSLVNEPACIWVAETAFACFNPATAIYMPTFNPTSLTENHVADDAHTGVLSYTLPAGASATAVFVEYGVAPCTNYGLVFGSDGPFAVARPALDGVPAAGSPMTTTTGAWGGSPVYGFAWLRCDADGGSCASIDGATAAQYTPTAADVGHTLRSRVTATQGKSLSSDSQPSAVVAQGPGVAGGDGLAPTAAVKLGRTNLQKVLKTRRIPLVVTCSEACAIDARVRVPRKLAKQIGATRIARGTGSGQAGRGKRINAKLTRRARRGLRGRRKVALKLVALLQDGAGNKGAARKKALLKRKRR